MSGSRGCVCEIFVSSVLVLVRANLGVQGLGYRILRDDFGFSLPTIQNASDALIASLRGSGRKGLGLGVWDQGDFIPGIAGVISWLTGVISVLTRLPRPSK